MKNGIYTSFFQNHGRLVNLNVGGASRWFYFDTYSRLPKHILENNISCMYWYLIYVSIFI